MTQNIVKTILVSLSLPFLVGCPTTSNKNGQVQFEAYQGIDEDTQLSHVSCMGGHTGYYVITNTDIWMYNPYHDVVDGTGIYKRGIITRVDNDTITYRPVKYDSSTHTSDYIISKKDNIIVYRSPKWGTESEEFQLKKVSISSELRDKISNKIKKKP
jgi:hypothetical protein